MSIETKLTTFLSGRNERFCKLVCTKCGSTCIDQNQPLQITCYNCDNTAAMDTTLFGVVRNLSEEDDAAGVFADAEPNAPQTDDGDWRGDITRANQLFINYVMQIIPRARAERGAPDVASADDLNRIKELWADAKARTDAIIASIGCGE